MGQQYENCQIVADIFGCSKETVRRALVKINEPRTNRHPRKTRPRKATDDEIRMILDDYYNTSASIYDLWKKYHRAQCTISKIIKEYGHGFKVCEKNKTKITDEQIISESRKGHNYAYIAKKYGLSAERAYQRCRRCGVGIPGNKTGGGGHWYRRCKFYGVKKFDKTITLDAVITRYNGICQICGQAIDKSDIINGHIRGRYPTVDHIIPISKGGAHTWDNVQLAHMACNAGKCDKI